ncbi:hypothetical protein WBU96_06905 [Bacillus albus]|uniref:hypothetical protein n=1 Tax=Bacillus cereus group TaxID=86661 RepID=UPI0022E4F529|nr:hypothetical protein [Bacillus cereus group sp. Bc177]MDA2320276.1 hypothetical protein [Bacillus cereus group sp. Bc177]
MNKIFINDVLLNIEEYQEKKGENEELKEFSFGFSVQGKNDYHLMKNLFKGKIKVTIPETEEEFFVKSTSSSYQYNGKLTDDTFVNIRHTLTVVDEKEQDLTFEQRLAVNASINEVKLNCLIELLIEKEVIIREEFAKKVESVGKRDVENLVASLYGQNTNK